MPTKNKRFYEDHGISSHPIRHFRKFYTIFGGFEENTQFPQEPQSFQEEHQQTEQEDVEVTTAETTQVAVSEDIEETPTEIEEN